MGLVMPVSAAKTFTLCIDAGHGGGDPGAKGAISKEKNLTLKYALAFGKLVEQNCPEVKVVYTRTTDKFVELWQRAEIANKAKADLFISIHINALPKGHIARGYQTYTLGRSRRNGNRQGFIENLEVAKRENAVILIEKDYKQHYEGFDPNSPESNIMFELIQDKNMENSVELAKQMQKYVCQATGRQDQGVHQDNLAVLRLTSMPACLLELGFISTPDEEKYLNSDEAVSAYSRGIYNAFMAYRGKVGSVIKGGANSGNGAQPGNGGSGVNGASGNRPGNGTSGNRPAKPADTLSDSPSAATVAGGFAAGASGNGTGGASGGRGGATAGTDAEAAPVFKVQILACDRRLPAGSPQLKGRKDAEYYKEGALYKYTVGASTNYREILQLRRELAKSFPGAFVIAFRCGEKMDTNTAIADWRAGGKK